MQVVWPRLMTDRCKAILLQQVINGDRALMFDLGVALFDATGVEMDRSDTLGASRSCQFLSRRTATERPCALSPSAPAKVRAAGPIAAIPAGLHSIIVVRFMKSSTPRPDA